MDRTSKKYRWMLVICYSLLGLCLPAPVTQFTMASAELAVSFNCSTRTILMADSTRAICLVAALFVSGYASRYLGRFKTICLGLTMQIAPQFLIPLAAGVGSLPMLFVFKGMQGLNAIAFPVYLSTIIRVAPSGAVGTSTAIFNGSFIAGAGAGAWISGQIIPKLGWEAAFYVVGLACLFFAAIALAVTPRGENDPALRVAPAVRSAVGTARPLAQKNLALYAAVVRNPLTWLLVLALSANTWVMQATIVDMPIFTSDLQIPHAVTGSLMFMIGAVTVASSVAGGAVSDFFAGRRRDPLRVRSYILAGGCVISAFAALGIVFMKPGDTASLWVSSGLMVFGISWAAGVFWALPGLVYREQDIAAATAFCAGASNIVNPIAPMVVGVLLGSAGLWSLGWLTCSVVSAFGFIAAITLPQLRNKRLRSAE